MTGPRIVLVGGNQESAMAASEIHRRSSSVVGHVLPAGRLAARTSDLDVDRIMRMCTSGGIVTHKTSDVNSLNTMRWLKELRPDVVFVLGWSQIFRDPLLDVPSLGVIGSHPTCLPRGRGRAPVSWTIMEGLSASAVTLFKMDSGVDTGDIVWRSTFSIPPRVHARELYDIISDHLGSSFAQLAELLDRGDVVEAEPQDEMKATYRHGRRPEDGELFFDLAAGYLDRLVRASGDPYPGAFSYYQGERVHFDRALLPSNEEERHSGVPGQVLCVRNDGLIVQSRDGLLGLGGITNDQGKDVCASHFRVDSRFDMNRRR